MKKKSSPVNIAIGSDHVGMPLKCVLVDHLIERGHTVTDVGCFSDQEIDYPVIARRAADEILSSNVRLGILICGTVIGMAIAANKIPGIRAAACCEPFTAKVSREHNDTNVLSLGARVTGRELALMITDTWLDARFEGGRHAQCLQLIADLEQEGKISVSTIG